MPGAGNMPAIWLLGSSDFSARLAGELGLPFSFAHHFMPQNTIPALEIYRRSFKPSPTLAEPYAMIGVAVVCAETDEQARWLHGPAQALVPAPPQRPPVHLPLAGGGGRLRVHARPAGVRRELDGVARGRLAGNRPRRPARAAEATRGADELMLTTNVYDHADRLRSYELVAQALAGPV